MFRNMLAYMVSFRAYFSIGQDVKCRLYTITYVMTLLCWSHPDTYYTALTEQHLWLLGLISTTLDTTKHTSWSDDKVKNEEWLTCQLVDDALWICSVAGTFQDLSVMYICSWNYAMQAIILGYIHLACLGMICLVPSTFKNPAFLRKVLCTIMACASTWHQHAQINVRPTVLRTQGFVNSISFRADNHLVHWLYFQFIPFRPWFWLPEGVVYDGRMCGSDWGFAAWWVSLWLAKN